MPEATFTQSFANFLRDFKQKNIKAPASIELANKEEALKIVWEVNKEDFLPIWGVHRNLGRVSYESIASKIESGEMQNFMLYGVEFWWRPSIVAVELPQDLKEAA